MNGSRRGRGFQNHGFWGRPRYRNVRLLNPLRTLFDGVSLVRLRHPVIFGLFIGVSTVVAAAFVFPKGPISATSSVTVTLDGAIGVNMKPSLTLREFTAIDSERFAVLEFGNPTTRTIYFYGYGPEYPHGNGSSDARKANGLRLAGTGAAMTWNCANLLPDVPSDSPSGCRNTQIPGNKLKRTDLIRNHPFALGSNTESTKTRLQRESGVM